MPLITKLKLKTSKIIAIIIYKIRTNVFQKALADYQHGLGWPFTK